MADFNSSLPVRTENPGDVIIKLADATTPSQQQAVNAAGSAQIDGQGVAGTPAGGVLTVQGDPAGTPIPVSGSITVSDPAEGPVGSPPPSDAIYIGSLVSTASPSYSNGNMESLSLTLAGALRVDGSAVTQPISAASLPLPAGAATSADQTNGSQKTQIVDGSGNVIASTSNALNVEVTNASLAVTQSGTWTVQQGSAPWSQNITQILGAAPSATNALATQLATAGAYVSSANPLPVTIDPASAGTAVVDYKDASAIASGASDNHDYTVTAGKTLHLQQIESSAAGKAKMQLQIETGVATGIFNAKASQFNSTATPDMSLMLSSNIQVAAGVRVRVVMSNRDLASDDLYSTIIGYEI